MQSQLETLGLTSAEAQVYLALVRGGAMRAQALAQTLGVPRSSVYVTLRTLTDKGLVETGEGYGSKFRATPPEEALPLMIDRERQAVQEREVLAKQVAEQLAVIGSPTDDLNDVVEVLRDRRVVAERFRKLQSEATEEIIGFAKPPTVVTRGGNKGMEEALARGVRVRTLYQPDSLTDPQIVPFLEQWADAGEQARVYAGELPFKLALFDGTSALMPLETPSDSHRFTAVLIRHPSLGAGLRLLFDLLWSQSRPLQAADPSSR